jgi:signal transduction histidine kinase
MNLTSLLKLALPPADHASPGVLELKLPFAEIDARGVVRRINALGTLAWGWSEETNIPRYVDMALEGASTMQPSELPFLLGGLLIGVIPDTAEGGWMLIGYASNEKGVRDVIRASLGEESISSEPEQVATHEAEEESKAKMAFISTLSHELRSPIGAITGYADLVERELMEFAENPEGELSPLVLEFVRAIGERSKSVQRVVKDLFELSELHNSDLGVDHEPVDIHQILSEAADRCVGSLEQSKVDLKLKYWDATIYVESNSIRLGQVFDNILSNAVKFTESGLISVRTIPEPEHVVIEIEDTGVGISHDFVSRAFDAFSQEDSRRARAYEGTGMGLALSRRLLENLGGTIDVSSKKGVGSIFRIRLPFLSPGHFATLDS